MADAYDKVFAEIGISGYSPTPTPYPSEQITTGEVSRDPYDSVIASLLQEEKPKEAGIWAHAKKGWSDMLDYAAISLQGLGYVGDGPDEDVIASNIASIEERARNTVTSESHKAILDLFRKEGKDVDEAEGFIQTSKEILDMVGRVL